MEAKDEGSIFIFWYRCSQNRIKKKRCRLLILLVCVRFIIHFFEMFTSGRENPVSLTLKKMKLSLVDFPLNIQTALLFHVFGGKHGLFRASSAYNPIIRACQRCEAAPWRCGRRQTYFRQQYIETNIKF